MTASRVEVPKPRHVDRWATSCTQTLARLLDDHDHLAQYRWGYAAAFDTPTPKVTDDDGTPRSPTEEAVFELDGRRDHLRRAAFAVKRAQAQLAKAEWHLARLFPREPVEPLETGAGWVSKREYAEAVRRAERRRAAGGGYGES